MPTGIDPSDCTKPARKRTPIQWVIYLFRVWDRRQRLFLLRGSASFLYLPRINQLMRIGFIPIFSILVNFKMSTDTVAYPQSLTRAEETLSSLSPQRLDLFVPGQPRIPSLIFNDTPDNLRALTDYTQTNYLVTLYTWDDEENKLFLGYHSSEDSLLYVLVSTECMIALFGDPPQTVDIVDDPEAK